MSVLLLPERDHLWGPRVRRPRIRALVLFGAVFACAWAAIIVTDDPRIAAFALGLMAPGGGFLAQPEASAFAAPLAMALASAAAFTGALVIWFTTGAVLAPLAVWLGAAILASLDGRGPVFAPAMTFTPIILLAMFNAACVFAIVAGRRAPVRRDAANAYLARTEVATILAAKPEAAELSIDEIAALRLLLDRALQPVDAFEGFEWIDQFQTAAIRYQLTFASFALSIAQAERLPAFRAYLTQAQERLVLKQLDPRVWRYWRLENLWGNLRASADPVPEGNIMFTGFLATQIALARRAGGLTRFDDAGSLAFCGAGVARSYRQAELVKILAQGLARAPLGLLSCEPNWIYPLCNIISACAIRAESAQGAGDGESAWRAIASDFRMRLEDDFLTADGAFIPFLSSLTGFAGPMVGGVVTQAFPCLFLNALFPDMAERQWLLARRKLTPARMRRALWPIDTGNYRFSRASSYAATAAAAVEMGDGEIAARLLDALDADCPRVTIGGVAHRPAASLWAHALDIAAHCGSAGAMRRLVTRPSPPKGPYIGSAAYPDILPALAKSEDGALRAVLYPGTRRKRASITIGGLDPERDYVVAAPRCVCSMPLEDRRPLKADRDGRAEIDLRLDGRIELLIHPAA